MQNQLITTLSVILLLLSVSACNQGPKQRADEWPPLVGWAEENFLENRASLEALESMLLSSRYHEVAGSGITVGTYSKTDGTTSEEIIEDNERWAHLLGTSTVFAVAREDGYTAYPTGLDPFSPNIVISSDNFEEVE